MKPTVILINFKNKEKLERIKNILRNEKIEAREVAKEEYAQTIGAIAGIEEFYNKNAVYEGEELSDEMLIFAGLEDGMLDNVLASMRETGSRVNYKAVMTPYNIAWKIPDLFEELAKEHEEMTKRYGK